MLRELRPKRPAGETKTMHRLRQQMAQIETRVQFEEILANAHEDHRGRMRKILEPMLPSVLPCCGPAMLSRARMQEQIQHSPRCPMLNLVSLT